MKTSNKFLLPAIIALLASVATTVTAGASCEAATENSISVTGNATSSVAPDLVNVRFGVEFQGKTAKEALATNSKFMGQVIDAVKQTGISEKEISTSQFKIYPVYERHQDRQTGAHTQVLVGYRVSNMVTVETAKLDLAAQIIDSAVEAGVNRIDRVFFSLSPEVREQLKNEMIEEAVLNAKDKAEKALAPLGYAITGVKHMTLTEFFAPAPLYADAARTEMARAAPTQIFAQEQDVKTTVNVTFLIGAK